MEDIEVIKSALKEFKIKMENDIVIEEYVYHTVYSINCFIEKQSNKHKIVDFIECELKREVEILKSYKIGYFSLKVESKEKVFIAPTFKETLMKDENMILPLFLGKYDKSCLVKDEIVKIDLAETYHLLIIGISASSKTNTLKMIISNLIFNKNPNEIKIILINMKQLELELEPFNEVQHLLCPIITDKKEAINTLYYIEEIIEERKKILKKEKVCDVKHYNEKVELSKRLPHIIIIIDETQLLLEHSRKKVELLLSNILLVGRTFGITLIATIQSPLLNKSIKNIASYFPSKLSLRLDNQKESDFILGKKVNANELAGKGKAFLNTTTTCGESLKIQICEASHEDICDLCENLLGNYEKQKFDEKLLHYINYGKPKKQ